MLVSAMSGHKDSLHKELADTRIQRIGLSFPDFNLSDASFYQRKHVWFYCLAEHETDTLNMLTKSNIRKEIPF